MFTHNSCAFAQKAKFYVLKMLKKLNLTHPNAAKLATLPSGQFLHLLNGPPGQFFRLLYGGPLRPVSLLTMWGPPQVSFFAYYKGLPQISFFAY